MELNEEKYTEVISTLEATASNYGLETYPFKIGWYNEALSDKKFELTDDYDTLAFVVISKPTMFEKAFLPFLRSFEGKFKNFFPNLFFLLEVFFCCLRQPNLPRPPRHLHHPPVRQGQGGPARQGGQDSPRLPAPHQ